FVPIAFHDIGAPDQQLADAGFGIGLEEVEVLHWISKANAFGPRLCEFMRQESRYRRRFSQPKSIPDPSVGASLHYIADQVRRDRSSAIRQPPYSAAIELSEIWLIDCQPVDCRNRSQHVYSLFRYDSQKGLDLERGHYHGRAPGFAGRQELAVAARHVKQWNRNQVANAAVARQVDDPMACLRIGEKRFVGSHRALGEPGRAAGVEDCREVLFDKVARRERRTLGQGLIWHKHIARSRIIDYIFDFGFSEARIDRDRHRSGQLNSEEGQAPVEPVSQANCYAVA